MESWRQRRAIVDNNMHWRNPLSAVRGNHVPFSSAFAWSPAAATVEAHEPARIFTFLSRIFSPFIGHDRVQKTSLSPFPSSLFHSPRLGSSATLATAVVRSLSHARVKYSRPASLNVRKKSALTDSSWYSAKYLTILSVLGSKLDCDNNKLMLIV